VLNANSLSSISSAVTNFVKQYNNALNKNANTNQLNNIVANHQMKIGTAVTNAVKKNRNKFVNANTNFQSNNPPVQRSRFQRLGNRLRGGTPNERAKANRNSKIKAIYNNTKQSSVVKKQMLNQLSANKTNERYVALLRKMYAGGVVNDNVKGYYFNQLPSVNSQKNASELRKLLNSVPPIYKNNARLQPYKNKLRSISGFRGAVGSVGAGLGAGLGAVRSGFGAVGSGVGRLVGR